MKKQFGFWYWMFIGENVLIIVLTVLLICTILNGLKEPVIPFVPNFEYLIA